MPKDRKVKEPPPLINHRWNLPCLEEIVDQLIPDWPEGKHPDFSGPDGHTRMRAGLLRFGQSLLSGLHLHLEKAAGKGIHEALAMIQNPEYHETVKRRRSQSLQRSKEWRKQSEKDALDRERRKRGELSEAERINELGNIAYHIHYHQAEIKKLEERKAVVEGSSPVSFESEAEETPRVIRNDGDSWPDTIFD